MSFLHELLQWTIASPLLIENYVSQNPSPVWSPYQEKNLQDIGKLEVMPRLYSESCFAARQDNEIDEVVVQWVAALS